MLQPHSDAWYDQLSLSQSSYYYPWRSQLPPGHGEDNYLSILEQELCETNVVLDAGCGSGELTNEIARFCQMIYGYDRVARFIETAQKHHQHNASFLLHDSRQGGIPRLPLDGKCIDWFISSKGPSHWIVDAPRIAKPNAKMMMLMPYSELPPEWNRLLPSDMQLTGFGKQQLIDDTEARLKSIGRTINRLDLFECSEVFNDTKEFNRYLTWGKFEYAYDESELLKTIDTIFQQYGENSCLSVPYNRLIWRSEEESA
jgi:SAM-dependent methyltransferase